MGSCWAVQVSFEIGVFAALVNEAAERNFFKTPELRTTFESVS